MAVSSMLLASLASSVAAAPAVDGLIIRLKPDGRQAALAQGTDGSASEPLRRERLAVAADTRLRGRMTAMLQGAGSVAAGATIVQPVGRAGHLIRWTAAPDLATLQARAEQLLAQPDVESVELDTLEPRLANVTTNNVTTSTVPSDPLFSAQSWLQRPSALTAGLPDIVDGWMRTTGSPTSIAYVPVAVLDTGMLADHPDLAGRWLPGYDFVSRAVNANDGDGRDADPSDPGDWVNASDAATGGPLAGCAVEDSSWHGTLIAGEIAASTNNTVGVAGINWEGRIVPVRVGGRCGAQLSDIIDGMRWAAGLTVLDGNGHALPANPNPARVINLSFGGAATCGSVFQDAIDELKTVGAVVVAAAGNASGAVSRPANCRGVIGVGALNAAGFKAPYSNFGPELVISTVGGDESGTDACSQSVRDTGILSTRNSGTQGPQSGHYDYQAVEGTSFSAPIVSGTVSLMLALNPALSVDQLIAGLRQTARPHPLASAVGTCSTSNAGRCACTTSTCGAGVLDAPRALAFAADPVNYSAPILAAAVVDDARFSVCSVGGSISPGGLTSITSPSDASAAAAPSSGGGSIDMAWLVLLITAIAATVSMHRSAPSARARRSGPRHRAR